MAKDIALNNNFDIFIDDRNDLGLVEGRQEVEQSIGLWVSLYFHQEIGRTDVPNVKDRLKLKARRTARENRRIDSVQDVRVEELNDEPNVYEVTISYNKSEEFDFKVND